jgi:NADH-quinone oxidoreductase subunit L
LIGFLINGFFGSRLDKKVSGAIGTVAVFAAFVVALGVFFEVQAHPAVHHSVYLAPWFVIPGAFNASQLQVNWELLIDPLSALMLLIITGIGGLIHLYSTSYMAGDKGYSRFFTYLNLFIFFMLFLVMGNNLVMMFVGWEGVGLCSYLLIGFWYEKKSAADAAKKAFIVNRVGDVGVLIGMFIAFKKFGTLDFYNGFGHGDTGVSGLLVQAAEPAFKALVHNSPLVSVVVTLLTLSIFWGCTGKSAQLPLYTWLPDAMEGPTPVSALIHAATMVTAGVYLVSRMHTLFELSEITMNVVAVIGIATALFAATIGLVQNDIKRVLAYSTMSQLGYMFAACGVGAFSAGMFHVMTHAFFKACLFLGSGAVIHAMEHAIHDRKGQHEPAGEHGTDVAALKAGSPDPDDPQDMRNMGGLRTKLPVTHAAMLVSTFAIAGIPFFSGFFSKDEILGDLAGRSALLWGVGALTAALTGFYMMRLMYKTFYGTSKTKDAEHTHEATPAVTVPLIILGALAVVGGYIGVPESWEHYLPFGRSLSHFLSPASGALYWTPGGHPFLNDGALLGISSAIAAGFVYFSYSSYKAKDGRDLYISPADKPKNFAYQLLLNKYYVDELYNVVFVAGGRRVAGFCWKILDVGVIDGLVNGIGSISRTLGGFLRLTQTGYVRNYAFSLLIGALLVVIACIAGSHNLP